MDKSRYYHITICKSTKAYYRQKVLVVFPIFGGFAMFSPKMSMTFGFKAIVRLYWKTFLWNSREVRRSRVLLILVAWVGQNIQNTEECKEGGRHKNLREVADRSSYAVGYSAHVVYPQCHTAYKINVTVFRLFLRKTKLTQNKYNVKINVFVVKQLLYMF